MRYSPAVTPGPKSIPAVRLSLLSAFAAELAFFFALAVVPFLGITLALSGRWLPPETAKASSAQSCSACQSTQRLHISFLTSTVSTAAGAGPPS